MVCGDLLFDYERPDEEQILLQQVVSQRPDLNASDPRVQSFIAEYLTEQKEARRGAFNSSLFRSLIFVLLGGGLLVYYRLGKIPRWTMQAAIALLVIVDLWGVDRQYLNADHFTDAPDASQQLATYDFDRFPPRQPGEAGGPSSEGLRGGVGSSALL